MYFTKTPNWLKLLCNKCIWQMPNAEKTIYLSFDDGPHPTVTPFVLDELKKYDAKASFFCIGKNVVDYEEIYDRILNENHSVGNHTHNHLNGWKTNNKKYIEDIVNAENYIQSKLFRPPYGRMKRSQINELKANNFKIIMWSLLSGDFDLKLSKKTCLENCLKNIKNGCIIVFHDSEKAYEKLQFVLPILLKKGFEDGYKFKAIY